MSISLNDPIVRAALSHVEALNTPRQWAELEILQFEHENVIRLHYGTIHTNGMRERAIASRDYYTDIDGRVRFHVTPHP